MSDQPKLYRSSMRAWGGSFNDILKPLYDNVRSGREDIISVEFIDSCTIEIRTVQVKKEVK